MYGPDRQRELAMERVRFTEHRGVRILHSDFSGIRSTEELQRAVRLGSELIRSQPPGSVLILVDVTGVEYSVEAFAILQQSVAANRPYTRARAIVGLPRAAAIPFSMVARIAGSPMASFDDPEAAKQWLISHA